MSKKLVLHSGGMDSLASVLGYIEMCGAENIISLGFNYGQRHFEKENWAAFRLCRRYDIPREVLNIPIDQIGGCSLIDKNIAVTTDMSKQRSTVVPQRNAIMLLFAAAYAQENDCDTIVHGAVKEDYEAYRDCRFEFFKLLEMAIQAGRTKPVRGSEHIYQDVRKDSIMGIVIPESKLDIKIDTPFINEKKEDIVKRIIAAHGCSIYIDSYTCYNGVEPSCGKCPACKERLHAFEVCGVKDPIEYGE